MGTQHFCKTSFNFLVIYSYFFLEKMAQILIEYFIGVKIFLKTVHFPLTQSEIKMDLKCFYFRHFPEFNVNFINSIWSE